MLICGARILFQSHHTIYTKDVKSILLRLPNWLGDSVMVSPAFEWLKLSFPCADFSIVGTKASCGIYERDSRIKHIFIDESKKAKSRILATKNLANAIGKHDLAITFSNTFFSALLLYLTKSPVRIGYAKNARGFLLTHALKLQKHDLQGKKYHQVLLYLSLIAPLLQAREQVAHTLSSTLTRTLPNNAPKEPISHKILMPNEILEALSTKPLTLISHSIDIAPSPNKPIIGINPGAAFGSAKRWEQSHFVSVIEYFLDKAYQVYLFGSSAESSANTDIANALKNHKNLQFFHNLTDKTNLSELIDHINAVNVFITNDSGPMHIATALKTPIVAIFGPTDINETAPYTPSHTEQSIALLHANLPCSPCKKRECPLKHHNCMKLISPQEVITSTLRVLEINQKRLNNDN
ncbi:lipopolysaccharide heptosyltransferase II [Helicobacter cinaedi]|uniref:lipopolysaccharide heptosyltransferase II n=1 Tax=Helicobacter cinaedi TaxID=213 RepID=A0A377JP04_9HELI|nr:lipopolysaccharide heptosyltransferase II [Helicobacter cinaedi]STP09519.1 ADP-heptose-LPS heptosyltransferase II [Helicobacter cinaedi]